MSGFSEDVRRVLAGREPGAHGDVGPGTDDTGLRAASVLVPLFEHAGDTGIVFVRRSEDLGAHAGQIAFPGGGRDTGEDELACALREAQEEIGLPPEQVEVIGRLDRYATITRYLVSPFVARLRQWPLPLAPDPREVAGILTVPVSRLTQPGALRTVTRETLAGPREINFFVVDEDVIWGATARMLRQMLELSLGRPLVPEGEVPWTKVRW